jgi:hypothetical protein
MQPSINLQPCRTHQQTFRKGPAAVARSQRVLPPIRPTPSNAVTIAVGAAATAGRGRSSRPSSRHVCRFRESDDKETELNAMEKSWRRHFTESDPPDESRGPQALVQRVRESD